MSQELPSQRGRLILLVIGPLATIAVLAIAWKRQYDVGYAFTPGLHAFGFMIEMAWIIPCLLVIAGCQFVVAGFLRSRFRDAETARLVTLISAVFSVMAMFVSWGVIEGGFRDGRNAAYQRVDLTRLVAGCRAVNIDELAGRKDASEVFLGPNDPSYAKLPLEIRELNPVRFVAGKRGVIVQMDGGGPASHEGFFVPIVSFEGDQAALDVIRYLDELSHNPRVYRFNLDDSRGLPFD